MLTSSFIHESIRYSLFRELDLSPKPGLVNRINNGCHKDMDYNLMAESIECISAAFFPFIEIGQKYSLSDSLEIARPLAVCLEEQMLSVTHNINTHKGAIYLFAITNIALGHALAHHKSFNDFLHFFEIINKNDYETLLLLDKPKSYGQKIYKQYGLTGIIGEVHRQLDSITTHALPLLEQNYSDSIILLSLIAHSEDTCILHHNDFQTYNKVKESALHLMRLGINHDDSFFQEYESFCNYCNANHISCGGSADLLALTFYFDIIQKSFFKSTLI